MAIFDIEAELDAVTTALNQQGIEYAVCGGVALAVHGHPRATKDIDVVVAEASVERTRLALRALGYTLGVVSRDGLIRMKRLAGRPQDLADLAALGAADE